MFRIYESIIMDNTKLQQLERRVEELEKQLKKFEFSDSIPENFARALAGRGFIQTGEIGQPPYTDWIDNAGFAYEPELGVYVQAAASQYLQVKGISQKDYFIPLLSLDESDI
jgi:hypothetical protein